MRVPFRQLYSVVTKAQSIAKLNGKRLSDIPKEVLNNAVEEGHCYGVHRYFASNRGMSIIEYCEYVTEIDEEN